jgi:hypothetical protein
MTAAGHAYAFIPDCGLSDEEVMFAVSHEIAEAATDPSPEVQPTWQSATPPGEIADLCGDLSTTLDGGLDADGGALSYQVQRLYSTKVAALGTSDPCVPAPSTPWFNVALDPMIVDVAASDPNTGQVGSAMVAPFSTGDVGPIKWTIFADGFDVHPSTGTSHAGERVPVTFQAIGGAAFSGAWPVYIEVSAGSVQQYMEATLMVE